MKSRNDHGITGNTYITLVKYFLLGVVAAEIFLFTFELVKFINIKGNLTQEFSWLWGLIIGYIILGLTLIWNKKKRIQLFFTSIRLDIVIMLLTGFFLICFFDIISKVFFEKWISIISSALTLNQIIVISALPILFLVSVIFRKQQIKYKIRKKDEKSRFMSDSEGTEIEDDNFEFNTQAEKFAESVYNFGSPKNLVFGIDAPWGTGKSTFINLCKGYWLKNYKNKTIVYNFNPLKYENRDNLFEKFVDGLINELRNHVFSPELEGLVSKYARLLKDTKATFSFFGVRFNFPYSSNDSIDKTFQELEVVLKSINKKIIIVVDDLDRISFSSIKEILFVIKKAFNLPNISYVLCYDTDSLNALDQHKLDSEKISEFLEKFINVKTSIYLDYKLLLEYFVENKNQAIENDLTIDPVLLNKSLTGLKEIFESSDFHYYLPYIGDARKIKRLVNTIILLEVEQTDFENTDFFSSDLIHLLLLYVNHPRVFRKIYNTETHGKKGFFSAKYNFSVQRGQKEYTNSSEYRAYVDTLHENEKFLLKKVFDVEKRIEKTEINEEMTSTYACFNGSGIGGRNLEAYINLITKMSRPLRIESYRYYIKQKDLILKEKTIKEVFGCDEFSIQNNEKTQMELWRVLVNTPANEFSENKAVEVIDYALSSVPKYSFFHDDNIVGFRNRLPTLIMKLIDRVGWTDASGSRFENNLKNIEGITDWIFGEGKHNGKGVLKTLGDERRGILGLIDLLSFRLSCDINRGGNAFNLSRSLTKHGNPKSSIEGRIGDSDVEEMREISQKVFQLFKSQYINKEKDIFSMVNDLSLKQLTGESYGFIQSQLEINEIKEIDKKVCILKSSLLNYIIYQLGNTVNSSGVGCGYYDSRGSKDNKEINKQMSEYLFRNCFSPNGNFNGYRNFLDYLLMNLQKFRDETDKLEYIANLDGFTHVLKVESLSAYWKEHRNLIKEQEFGDRTVMTRNYTATYTEDLRDVFMTLDTLINEELPTPLIQV
ncbi:P-loop NTPase fold protein [Paenibacillus sp. FSL H7-0943]|uniref:P-loop NTPase fold protein n=1 Tax=Paenibacillus sp. FSL H7-0943 TaxID=2954739 RepID=UPI0030D01A23